MIPAKNKKPCLTAEQRARLISRLKTAGMVGLAALNFLEDVLADVSAIVAAALAATKDSTASSEQVVLAVVLSVFANLSGLIYDVQQLGVKLPLPERDVWYSHLIHFLVAAAVTGTYVYSTYNGAIEDFDTDPITNTTQFPVFINGLGLSNSTITGLAALPTSGWLFSEGVSGFTFFAGKKLMDKMLGCLAKVRCGVRASMRDKRAPLTEGANAREAPVERLKNSLSRMSFLFNAVGFAAITLQAWSSLFDVFAVTAASQFEQPESALVGFRVLTGFLALSLMGYAYDYYLREAQDSWVCKCVASVGFRLFAALGVAGFFFAVSFNRARHFLTDIFALPVGLGESGF